jgi:S1-C subfamily serine protease
MRAAPMIAITSVLFTTASASAATTPAPGAFCAGAYADELTILSNDARAFDRSPDGVFSYCTRNTATYECLSYGLDGAVRRERRKAVLHGTAFAYRKQGPDTLLLTNDHVAAWPAVTDAQHGVDGIPPGCKKTSESLALVDDEHDSYTHDDVPVTRVVTDPQLDVAILKTQASVHVMPWKIGRSAAMRERNVVEVRGFPLGAFRATNVGKVISAIDHDDYGDWDHDDFVVDALLSSGNSGSPVLAVSCTTGEYELVGVFHAGYSAGSALNVVVGIDQVRDMMTTLKRTPRSHKDDAVAMDATSRASVEAALGSAGEMFFPFGPTAALVRRGPDGGLVFAVFGRDFPITVDPLFVVEELPPAAAVSFGQLGRTWFGSPRGLEAYDRASLDADTQQQAVRALEALRSDAVSYAVYRTANGPDLGSRQASDRMRRMSRTLSRTTASRVDLFQGLADLAERLAPPPGERGQNLDMIALGAPRRGSSPDQAPGLPTIASSRPPAPSPPKQ